MAPSCVVRDVVSRWLVEDYLVNLSSTVVNLQRENICRWSFAGLTGQQIGLSLPVHARAAVGCSWKTSPADIASQSVSTFPASGLWEMG